MKHCYKTAAVGIFLLAVQSGVGQANPMEAYFNGEKNSCFARTYSKDHLKKHPRQQVSYIAVDHLIDKKTARESLQQYVETNGSFGMGIRVRFRDSGQNWSEALYCERVGDHLRCGVECDGGGLTIHARGKDKILIKTEKFGFRVMADGGCGDAGDGDDTVRYINRKSDDKVFLLWRVNESECGPSGVK